MNNSNPLLAEVKVLTSKKTPQISANMHSGHYCETVFMSKMTHNDCFIKKTCRFIFLGLKVIILVPLFPYLSLANGPRNCLIHNPQPQE